MDFLTAGTYRINTVLFQVITSANTGKHGVSADKLRVYSVQSDKVGIVTTAGHTQVVKTMTLHPQQPFLASGSSDKTIRHRPIPGLSLPSVLVPLGEALLPGQERVF